MESSGRRSLTSRGPAPMRDRSEAPSTSRRRPAPLCRLCRSGRRRPSPPAAQQTDPAVREQAIVPTARSRRVLGGGGCWSGTQAGACAPAAEGVGRMESWAHQRQVPVLLVARVLRGARRLDKAALAAGDELGSKLLSAHGLEGIRRNHGRLQGAARGSSRLRAVAMRRILDLF